MKSIIIRSFLIVVFAMPLSTLAHHGKEFLVSSTYKTPPQGRFFALLSSNYLRHSGKQSHFELSPGVLYGVTNRWSAELHTHHSRSEGHLHSESIALETRYRIFGSSKHDDPPPEAEDAEDISVLSLAALLEYEKSLVGASDAAEARLMTGRDFHRLSIILNFILRKELNKEDHLDFTYALGIKTNLIQRLAAGMEIDGGTSHQTGIHLTPGLYAAISENLDLRVGASFGISKAASDATSFHAVLIYAF